MAEEKVTIDCNPEFGVELALAVPYAKWLYDNNQLEKVITSVGMKPFYYFCQELVEEKYNVRDIDNERAGVHKLHNTWLHGVKPGEAPGVLNYEKWTPPDYVDEYKNVTKNLELNSTVIICNKYTIEHGEMPVGYFDIKCLYDMFTYFKSIGLTVIYKRPKNNEFPVDQNDKQALRMNLDLKANIKNIGIITDYQLCDAFDNVINFDDFVDNTYQKSKLPPSVDAYNLLQLGLFSNDSIKGFITPSGGGSILCSCFEKPVVVYATHSGECRPGYLTSDESYYRKLSGASIHPVYDKVEDIKKRGYNDYTELLTKVKEVFK